MLVDDHIVMNVDFTIECHGMIAKPNATLRTTYVSSHWIRCCLEVSISYTFFSLVMLDTLWVAFVFFTLLYL